MAVTVQQNITEQSSLAVEARHLHLEKWETNNNWKYGHVVVNEWRHQSSFKLIINLDRLKFWDASPENLSYVIGWSLM